MSCKTNAGGGGWPASTLSKSRAARATCKTSAGHKRVDSVPALQPLLYGLHRAPHKPNKRLVYFLHRDGCVILYICPKLLNLYMTRVNFVAQKLYLHEKATPFPSPNTSHVLGLISMTHTHIFSIGVNNLRSLPSIMNFGS